MDTPDNNDIESINTSLKGNYVKFDKGNSPFINSDTPTTKENYTQFDKGNSPLIDSDTPPTAGDSYINNKSYNNVKSNLYKIIIIFIIIIILYFGAKKLISKNNQEKITVISIYFGSINSGYYIIKDSNISLNNYNIDTSELILDEYGFKKLEFGNDAHRHSKSKLEDEKRLYFNNFQKYLIQNESIDNITITPDMPKGRQAPLGRVIKEYLVLLKDNIIETENLKYQTIKWVIIVPTSWNKKNKEILRNIAVNINMDNCEIISELEAASSSIFYDKNIGKFLEKNTVYMIINSDLFNTNIGIKQIIDNKNNSKELIPSISYSFGSFKLNEKIIEIMKHVLGKEKINKNIKENYDIWEITLDDIEKKIEALDHNINEYIEIRTDFNKDEGIFEWGLRNSKEKEYNGYKIKYIKGTMFIPFKIIKEIIKENIVNIQNDINNINNLISEIIDVIIFTGEFSKNKFFQYIIRDYYNEKYNVFFLKDYEKNIMKAAAIYGLKNKQNLRQ